MGARTRNRPQHCPLAGISGPSKRREISKEIRKKMKKKRRKRGGGRRGERPKTTYVDT
jgi:hypothetical protein